jgi:hypothetical protein
MNYKARKKRKFDEKLQSSKVLISFIRETRGERTDLEAKVLRSKGVEQSSGVRCRRFHGIRSGGN